MYIVKVGDQPYVGMDLGVWEKRDGAVGCAERYIKNSAYFVEWVKTGEDKWSCGCHWLHIYEVELNHDLY
mgnify:FL=1